MNINKLSAAVKNTIFGSKIPHDREHSSLGSKISNIKSTSFISYFKLNLDKINKKNNKVLQAPSKYIDLKLQNDDISNKSLKKLEKKILKMNKKYSFLESHDEMNKIKSNVSRANILVRDKISTMLDYKFGITIRDKNNNSLNEKKIKNREYREKPCN